MTDLPDFVRLAASVKAVGEPDAFPGGFEVIASTKALDRDNESIRPGALSLPESAPFYFEHDWKDGNAPIGRGVPTNDGELIKAVGTWARTDRAQEIRGLVVDGIVDSCSVGFLNGRRETTKGITEVVSGELFEISFTAIPINPDARVLAAKALELGTLRPAAILAAGRKSVSGSIEQRLDELYEVLSAAYADADWVERLATFDDSVVYEVHGGTADDTQWECPYTFDGNEVTLGTAEPVLAVESLTITKPNGADSADAEPAAKAAGSATDDDTKAARAVYEYRLAASIS